MQPYGFPFVDTLAVFGGVEQSAAGAGGANQFEAMPSKHIGWTTIAALWLAAALPWYRIGLVLGLAHLTLMCVTVVVTGNHYVLDIIAGFVVVAIAAAVAQYFPVIMRREP
jgi:membrane-associated phospholipid phosphatase